MNALAYIGAALVGLACLPWARILRRLELPDDPWMLEHRHQLSHTYSPGMEHADEALQHRSNMKHDKLQRRIRSLNATRSRRPGGSQSNVVSIGRVS